MNERLCPMDSSSKKKRRRSKEAQARQKLRRKERKAAGLESQSYFKQVSYCHWKGQIATNKPLTQRDCTRALVIFIFAINDLKYLLQVTGPVTDNNLRCFKRHGRCCSTRRCPLPGCYPDLFSLAGDAAGVSYCSLLIKPVAVWAQPGRQ